MTTNNYEVSTIALLLLSPSSSHCRRFFLDGGGESNDGQKGEGREGRGRKEGRKKGEEGRGRRKGEKKWS